MSSDSRPPTPDSLLHQVAHLSSAGLPLAAGLRAAAEEADSSRLSWAFRDVATQIEQGQPLAEVLATSHGLPPHLAGLVRASQQSGQMGSVLTEWLANRRAAREHWRTVLGALTYPTITIVLSVLIYLIFATVVVRPFQQLIIEFGLRTPGATRALYWVSETGLTWFLWLLGISIVVLVVWRVVGGRAAWSWLMTQLPLIGPAWHWSGVAEWLRSLGLLIDRQMPLPEALRLTAGGVSDAHVGRLSGDLAKRVEQGRPLFAAILDQHELPVSIVPLVRVGEEQGDLPEALRAAAQMLEGRLSVRSILLVQVLPPLVFIGVAVLVLALFGLIGTTVVQLITGLS